MSELYLVYRDIVGSQSTVLMEGNPALIKDLPAGKYNIYHEGRRILENAGPNRIPGYLLNYCTRLEEEGFRFKGKNVPEKISNLELKIEKANPDISA